MLFSVNRISMLHAQIAKFQQTEDVFLQHQASEFVNESERLFLVLAQTVIWHGCPLIDVSVELAPQLAFLKLAEILHSEDVGLPRRILGMTLILGAMLCSLALGIRSVCTS